MHLVHKAMLGLACLTAAAQAQAARTITMSLNAEGTGVQTRGYTQQGFPINEPLQAANITFVLNEAAPDYYIGGTIDLINVTAASTGLRIFPTPFPPSATPFNGNGMVCGVLSFAVTNQTVDRSCSPISFFVGVPGGTGLMFNGFFTSISITEGGTPGAVSVTTFVPEPSTWALMLAGFGLTGYALRRRRAAVAIA